jgi:hypothetical protein
MGDIVLVDLDHRPQTLFLVFQACLATNAYNFRIIGTGCNQAIKRVFSDTGVCVDHEKILIQLGVHPDNIVDLVEYLELKRRHG